ncbi:SusC/RagA family TonB-linked outer membrane protein [Flavobacterium aquicola]|uniref:TonB-linked SusC/RagA family outer membrane protein n=1 Tax=Flavobacterium aquicola TaxID=1682742 RepID=A0A3E0EJ03_9FLAO|nr:SusC/RagA family TonB-linked outer membrane protein [Flavobacterium aquicola]REG98188.1 TonB-linked SusC/RagA family outer membrane protein [Flavobacterium aquicola]
MKLKFNGFLVLLVVLVAQLTFAQERSVSGIVSDNAGMPLPGVSVLIKGTKNGTQSDFDGKYSIKAAPSDVLIFSYIGMKSTEKSASSTTLNVKLTNDATQLESVVVTTALGIKREKKSLGYSATTVGSEELNKSSQSNIADALKGKVAGVTISSASSDPGASSGVIIRGFSSLTGNNQPLYVVDGIPINNGSSYSDDLSGGYDFGRGSGDINPEDIETMSLLKGAAATALYGSRAASGVILITTKKGKSGKMEISYSNATNFTEILRTPKYQDQFGQGWNAQHFLGENGSWGPKFDGAIKPWGNVVDNAQKIKPFSFQEDQLEHFFDTGTSYLNSLSISGGTGDSTVRLSYSNSSQDGIMPTEADAFNRNTLGLSASTKVKKLTIGGNLNYVSTSGSGVATGQGLTVMNNLMQIPTDISITEFKDYKNDPFNTVSNYYTPYGVTNPYFTLNENGSKFTKDRIYGSIDLNYELNSWSNVIYRFGIDQSSESLAVWQERVDALPGSPNDGSSTEQPGSYFESKSLNKQVNHEFLYNLNLELSSDLELESSFGFNVNQRDFSTISGSVKSQDIAGFHSFDNSTESAIATSSISKRKLYGIYNTSTLSFKKQLYLTGTLRNDWYSTLPEANRSVLYGGINASWVFTDTFPEIKDIVNFGKLRANYGETGVDTNPYQVGSVYTKGTVGLGFGNLTYPFSGVNGYEVGNRAANPDLQPERRKEYEFGIEASLFKNFINLDFSYYKSKIVHQIVPVDLAASTGYTTQTANVGTISNEGIEALVTLNFLKPKNNGFGWSTTVNFARNNSMLEKLETGTGRLNLGGLSTTALIAKEGSPLALIEGSVPETDPDGNIVVDVNGIPVASPIKQIYGDTQYDYTMGIGNTLSYKNITLDFSFDIRQGGLMYSRTADITRFTGNSITTTINDRQPWIVPGSVTKTTAADGTVTYKPNTTPIDMEHQDDYYSAVANNRETVIDKSFVKLREIIISYQFPKTFLKSTPINTLSFSVVGRNLFLWTPSSNQYIDPETSTFGTDLEGQFGEFSANPSTRSIGFSLKANF